MNTVLKIITGISLLVIVGMIYVSTQHKSSEELGLTHTTTQEIENGTQESTSEASTENLLESTITIPLASLESAGDVGPFGCGQYLNWHAIQIPNTSAPLNASYQQLFSLPYDVPGSVDKNIIASQENLSFDSVEISNQDALVYLSGTIMGNHCADEVLRHQIEQTAFQFDTIDSITVFLNGEIFDWCVLSDADPSESGCDTNPKLWKQEKQN